MKPQMTKTFLSIGLCFFLSACQGQGGNDGGQTSSIEKPPTPPGDTAGSTPSDPPPENSQTPPETSQPPDTPQPPVTGTPPVAENPPVVENPPPSEPGHPTQPGIPTNPENPPPSDPPVVVNPPPAEPEVPPAPGECDVIEGTVPAGTISLNDGVSATNSTSVTLSLASENGASMRISPDDHCGCGTWEPFAQTKVWTLPALNQMNQISVQFRDLDGKFSACAKASILHDDQNPEIELSLDSSNTYLAGSATKLNFSARDEGSGIQTLKCDLNGKAVACSTSDSSIFIPQQSPGAYTFKIQATDTLQQTATRIVSWDILHPGQDITQEHEILAKMKVDFLFVVDNSKSMAEEQAKLSNKAEAFLNVLTGLDWRLAVTTTDARSQMQWGDGRLLEFKGSNKATMISPETDPQKVAKMLADTVQRNENGSAFGQGILTTYRSIERSLISTDPASLFFRKEAQFAALLLSDKDESASNSKNKPENLLKLMKTTWSGKNLLFQSIITRPNDETCKQSNSGVFGVIYNQMSVLTGAKSGSICQSDYGAQLKTFVDKVNAMKKTIPLKCQALGDPNSSVVVLLNQSNYAASYEVKGDRLIFSENLPAGKYSLQYRCQE